ncbi:unnamed protein product [Prorocentrum cordatum]|uniref:Uncharacterized protein n=1 Tax=Prorocentrum cordatum TaxID=2364126 RepID=A0ABN9QC93_9DINO|nr:unnamed protein product [Polarella glacialis]
MKQTMGALSVISWALREHPPHTATELFLDLPEDVDEEVCRCFDTLDIEIRVWPEMPATVAAVSAEGAPGRGGASSVGPWRRGWRRERRGWRPTPSIRQRDQRVREGPA